MGRLVHIRWKRYSCYWASILLVHEIMYFGRCLPWFIIDQIPYFRKYKIQPDSIPTNQQQWECFKAVLKSHFLVEALPIWLFHPLCAQLNIIYGVPFPSWKVQACQIVFFFICEDFWHYTFHRLFHYGWFYKTSTRFIINMLHPLVLQPNTHILLKWQLWVLELLDFNSLRLRRNQN